MQNFAFRIPFNPLIFAGWLIATVAFVLVLALISVSTVTVKAATLNPSDSLRYE
jgi:ABC-type antimicrobial peptide transport system permease subunit